MKILGYSQGSDPSACLFEDGKILAYCEEERLIRYKHAPDCFPVRAMEACLRQAGCDIDDVDRFAYGWDAPRYSNGGMRAFYSRVNALDPPDGGTLAWQERNLRLFDERALRGQLRIEISRYLGARREPDIHYEPHHRAHAVTAYCFSPFEEALVLVMDGSGDSHTTTLWRGRGRDLELVHAIEIPVSLGWFYSAITELLGFRAYDGEYKVMGLAAYGCPHERFRRALSEVVRPGPLGFDHAVDPKYIHRGPHTASSRFTDHLPALLDLSPRPRGAPLTGEHECLAFEAQRALEEHTLRLLHHFRKATGLGRLCMAGGVAANVKLNSRILREGLFDDLFVFPIPSDSGTAIGAAAAASLRAGGPRPPPLTGVYLGPSFTEDEIERELSSCQIGRCRPPDIAEATADLLQDGRVVAWFQGRMEGGPRALGARSILADPRRVESRDRLNAAVKLREPWRPFCPSLLEESASEYLRGLRRAPFMIVACEATEEAKRRAPAIVHVDGTVRPQTVARSDHPLYHRLLEAFGRRTGVPVLLNTSFNVKGEALVCSPRDALRTFFSTGIDAMAIGPFLIDKRAGLAR